MTVTVLDVKKTSVVDVLSRDGETMFVYTTSLDGCTLTRWDVYEGTRLVRGRSKRFSSEWEAECFASLVVEDAIRDGWTISR